jgi:hypothetical protein
LAIVKVRLPPVSHKAIKAMNVAITKIVVIVMNVVIDVIVTMTK